MSVKRMPCKDIKVLKNGTTTIVTTESEITLTREFYKNFRILEDLSCILGVITTKGVSKLHPEDEYDEKTGRIIASKKAELKANKIIQTRLLEMRKALANMRSEIEDDILRLAFRAESLKKSLKE